MRVVNMRTIAGPGVYHHRPTIQMTLELDEFTEKSSTDFPGFRERLLALLPDLWQHHCSPGRPGGFVERLGAGTYFAHIIEHVALALSELAGVGVDFGKAVSAGTPGCYHVVTRYRSERAMRFLLRRSVALVAAVVRSEPVDLDAVVDEARSLARTDELGPSTHAVLRAAEARNIPWRRLDEEGLLQLGYGRYRRLLRATTTEETGDLAVSIARDKELTKKFLAAAAIRIPRGSVVRSEEELIDAFRRLEGPAVVKPLDANHGRGVSTRLRTQEEVVCAFQLARAHSPAVLIEEWFEGNDYRILVVDGRLVAAAHRVPAFVTGDGRSSLAELIRRENENPLRGPGHEKPLTEILIDEEAEFFLNKSGVRLEDVPGDGELVYLRETANLSTGGIAIDVTDTVHPDVRLLCERAARVVGLDVAGIDLILPDIAKSFLEQDGGVIEVNAGPGIRMHHYPAQGTPRDAGAAIVESLFKDKRDGRISIVAVTGTNGKTTVTRMLGHVLHEEGLVVGMTTTDGIYHGRNLVSPGDTTGPASAQSVLGDPTVDVAVLETARGGIVRRGLGYDWASVGVLTNIQADHIGQDGIEDLADILWIKSLVVERVIPGGAVVVNAGAPVLREFIRSRSDVFRERRAVLFTTEDFGAARELLPPGGSIIALNQGDVVEFREGVVVPLFPVAQIPATMGGSARFQVENVLAVVAAARALELDVSRIFRALATFHNADNPGRTNLYRLRGGHFLLDYGHNSEAFRSVGEMVRQWGALAVTAVIGVPGDRSDEITRAAGRAAAEVFDRLIVREDDDLRGRNRGDVARLLVAGAREARPTIPVTVALDAHEALRAAVEQLRDHEVVVYFYEERTKIIDELQRLGAGVVDAVGAVLEDHGHG